MQKIYLCAIALFCASCKKENFANAKKNAENFYTWRQGNNIDSILTLFAVENEMSYDTLTLVEKLKTLKELGDIISHKYFGSKKEIKYHSKDGKSEYTTLFYHVSDSSGDKFDDQLEFLTNKNNSAKLFNIKIEQID